MQCNVTLRKLLSVHKRHVRETIIAPALYQVRNSQTSRFVSVPACRVKILEGQVDETAWDFGAIGGDGRRVGVQE